MGTVNQFTSRTAASVVPGRLGTSLLRRLRAVLLLGGSVRPTQLTAAIGRSLLSLPVRQDTQVIDLWAQQFEQLAQFIGAAQLPVRVMVDRNSPLPQATPRPSAAPLRVEYDPRDFRGTGGVVRDACLDYHDQDYVLAVSGAQVMLDPLVELVEAMANSAGDVAVLAHRDGTPSGIQLIRCGCLRALPDIGFVDLKEQALPAIAASYTVRVVYRERASALPLRTLHDYLYALRQHHRQLAGKLAECDPFEEEWHGQFALVEPGARIDPSARLHDSVVLAGGTVGSNALLVRCLVCPQGVVDRGRNQVDQLIGPVRARGLAT